MKSIFDSAFAHAATLTDDSGSTAVRAFIEPKSAEVPEVPAITAAGIADGRRWRIILPPLALNGEATLTDEDGNEYRLLRWESVGNGHHIEALACREEAAAC